MDIEKQIQLIDDKNHYLLKAHLEKLSYFDSFKHSINDLSTKLTEQQLKDLLTNKLQVKQGIFAEKTYIQFACETTVNSYFSKNYEETFQYEPQINPKSNKNVDCQIKDFDYIYNVEVKCSSFEGKENIDEKNAFTFEIYGRDKDYDKTKDAMKELSDLMARYQEIKGKIPKSISEEKKMDNNLRDFLILSNKKFNPIPNENEVNILVVCCDDANDMKNWHSYMFAPQGLFTENSFGNPNEYNLVDLVVLSNIYYRHFKYFDKSHLKNNWDFSCAFNLAFKNPFRRKNKEKSIDHFLNIFYHYTDDFEKYIKSLNNDPESIILCIPEFVRIFSNEKGKIIF